MKTMKKMLCVIMAIALMVTMVPNTVTAKTVPKLNKKKVTLTITKAKKNPAVTLKVKGITKKTAKKVKWSTSNKKVAAVKKGKVTAKKAGKATITCKVNGRKLKCKVTVKDKRTSTKDNGTLKVTVSKKASETGLGPVLPLHVPDEAKRQISNVDIKNIPDPVPNGEEPYAVNQIKVTYNGKDVTNEARYEIDEPQVASVASPGTIKVSKYGKFFNFTVSYKGISKTIKMTKIVVTDKYTICYCGAVLNSCNLLNPCGACGGSGPYCPRHTHWSKTHCEGYWIGPYPKYIDIEVKQ